MFLVWLNILKVCPNTILWLVKYSPLSESNLKNFAETEGINSNRIIFTSPLPKREHILRITLADLVLDTIDRNSHSVSVDCLWAGVPVITSLGIFFKKLLLLLLFISKKFILMFLKKETKCPQELLLLYLLIVDYQKN